MPNLVGLFRPAWREDEIARALRLQLDRVRTPGRRYSEYIHCERGFGMALQDHGLLQNGPQPVRSADGRLFLLLDGEVLNIDELARKYHSDVTDDLVASPPAVCLRLIELYGPEIAHQFNGLFAIVLWDRAARRLQLISDHFGFRPLFYVSRPGEVLFGTELKALRAADSRTAQLDETGTFELFCYGSHILNRTWLRDYLRLGPATILTADAHGMREHSYWTYRYDEAAPRLDQETYATLFATLLDRAVERCMRGSMRIGMFLSGGYDSRAVAASLRSHHLPIPAFTFGYEQARDVRFARLLCQRLGLEHRPITRREPHLYRSCKSIVWRTEGLLPFADTTSIRFHAELSSSMDIFLTGLLGEFSGSHTWPRLLLARSRAQAARVIAERFFAPRLPLLRRLFTARFYARASEAAAERLRRSFDAVKDEHPLNVADSWNLMHVQPMRSYQAPCVDRHVMEMRAPHMDFELVSFLLTIPPYARLEQRVYKKMIAYRFPPIRDVPCTNSGLAIDPHFGREYAKMLLRFAGRKLAAPIALFGSGPDSLGRESDDPDEEFRSEPELVSEILRPAMKGGGLSPEVFDHAGIEAIIDEHYGRRQNHASLLSVLVSHALACKFFLLDDVQQVAQELVA